MNEQGDVMNWSARIAGNLTLHCAAQAMLLAGYLTATSAEGQTARTTVSPEMAGQKARMLETFFSSYRLRAALGSYPDAAGPLEAEARAKLLAGKIALADGRVAEAMEMFDAGMRAVSRAIALTSPATRWNEQAASEDFAAQRRHSESYLSVLESTDDISTAERTKVASLRARLAEADQQFANGRLRPALDTLDHAYRDIVDLVSDIRRGNTVVVSKIFQTPEEEFDYERKRNQSYDLLVQIALAERGENKPGLTSLAARLSAESTALRVQAEQESAGGNAVAAIGTMERATERLLVILRASGLVMME
jgi:hypothetical protein